MKLPISIVIATTSMGLIAATSGFSQQAYQAGEGGAGGANGSGQNQWSGQAGNENGASANHNGSGNATGNQNTDVSRTAYGESLFHANKIIGTQAQNLQGQNLGNIHDVVFTRNGQLFAAIGIGNGRFALVPWQALRINQNASTGWFGGRTPLVTVNATRQGLQNAPAITGQNIEQVSPRFIRRVYSYFNLGGNAAMGGGTAGLGGVNRGASANAGSNRMGASGNANGAGAGVGANVGGIGAGVGAGSNGGANGMGAGVGANVGGIGAGIGGSAGGTGASAGANAGTAGTGGR